MCLSLALFSKGSGITLAIISQYLQSLNYFTFKQSCTVKVRAYRLNSFNLSVLSSSLNLSKARGFSSLSSNRQLVGGYNEKGLLPTQESEQLSSLKFNTKRELTGDYIAGLCQADGSFSAVLNRKTRGDKEYFNLSLVFTLVQSQKYKNLLLEIQKK